MPKFERTLPIDQLPKRKGGYYHVKIDKELGARFNHSRPPRIVCTLDGDLTFPCALSHYGDGNYYILISTKRLKRLGKKLGDDVHVLMVEDLTLGVAVPEELEALIEQDANLKAKYAAFTDGKKRSMIHRMNGIKDFDKKVQFAVRFLETDGAEMRRKRRR